MARSRVTVRASAKVNLSLCVGGVRADGFHPLETVFQAVDLYDDVVVTPAAELEVVLRGEGEGTVGVGPDNLAWRAAKVLAERAGIAPHVRIELDKRIPVAGGMAGGSADAAGALVACDALWELGLTRAELLELAASLGSDVPFSVAGGTELGRGRGDQLTTVLTRGTLHWVFAMSDDGLSTPAVYREYDRLRPDAGEPRVDPALLAALAAGDPTGVARGLVNDLQAAALSLQPRLAKVLRAGTEAGALAGIVSGSGPTCAFLVRSVDHGLSVSNELQASGLVTRTVRATGPARGAHVVAVEG